MNKKRIVGTILIIPVLVMTAGCGKKEPQKAALALPSNPTTGYTWEATQTDSVFDITSEYIPKETEEAMVGAGGTETFIMTPKEKGKTEVTFVYGQHWEDGETGTALTYDLEVDKNLQIKVVSMKGTLPGDADTLPEIPELEIS